MPHAHRSARRVVTGLALVSVAAALSLSGVPISTAQPSSPLLPAASVGGTPERRGEYDARAGLAPARLQAQQQTKWSGSAAERRLDAELGVQGVRRLDDNTGTVDMVGRLDGFLTPRSKAPATTVALRYVRSHLAALGLTRADLSTLTLRRDYRDIAGIHHLSWTQSSRGIQVFGNGLKANVTKHGELISLQGSPVSGLAASTAGVSVEPALDAGAARTAAAKDVGGSVTAVPARTTADGRLTRWSNHDQAQLVWFAAGGAVRLGWSTYVQSGGDLAYQHVIDARSGGVLLRHDTVDFDRAPGPVDLATTQKSRRGDALVVRNYPGAPRGGRQSVYNLVDHKLLSRYAQTLSGAYVTAFADVNDNNLADVGETVPVPGADGAGPQYKLVSFNQVSPLCSPAFVCTWDPDTARSWTVNAAADVTQGFYFDSVFHNYLKKKPFGFTRAAGNFEARDGDEVQLNALDGADTAEGLPDANHVDNANMNTPPDGFPPTMQMYLFHAPGASAKDEPIVPTSSSFDASIITHEYTHGLSNRLVVDAAGNSGLNSIQAGSMGEAWSDYYSLDWLVAKKLEKDTRASGEVITGRYVGRGESVARTMGIDCPVKTTSARCTDRTGKTGGYTYGDFTFVRGTPEVHSSGEIWSQALWDLRGRLGHTVTGMLATRAMELSPAEPTFLDMRNAILQADQAVYRGRHRAKIWKVFAGRGMGFFAGTLDASDVNPAEDFSSPPPKGTPRVTVRGRVVDGLTGKPLAGAVVAIGGHEASTAGSYRAVTNSSGRFAIKKVFIGTYPLMSVVAPAYEILTRRVQVVRGGTTVDFAPRRDWAATGGGASIAAFNGPDATDFGCGPAAAIDLNQSTGWITTTGNDQGAPTNVMIPKFLVVKLPSTITLTTFSVDPSSTCGSGASASTASYRIETSADAKSWTVASSGTFTAADRGHLVPVSVPAPIADVAYVRFTILSPQVPDFATSCPNGAFDGCLFAGLTELEVFGTSGGI